MFSRFERWIAKQRAKCRRLPWNNCTRPERSASTEFPVSVPIDLTPEARRHSLPRRQLSNLLSERNNKHDEEEQLALKEFLKEHGLYNKHQTVQQRRRLKHLLELEQHTLTRPGDECAGPWIELHSLRVKDNDKERTSPIELHSMPFQRSSATANILCYDIISPTSMITLKKVRRVTSLPLLKSPKDINSDSENPITTSQPTIAREVQARVKPKCMKTISWKNFTSTIETAV